MKAAQIFSSHTVVDGLTVCEGARVDDAGTLVVEVSVSGNGVKAWERRTEPAKGSEAKVAVRAAEISTGLVDLCTRRTRAGLAVTP